MSSSRKGGTVADGDGDCIDSTMAAPVEQTSGRELQEAAHLAAMAEVLDASPGQGIFVQPNGKETPNGALTMGKAGSQGATLSWIVDPSFFNFTCWD